jgi:DNA polymerase III subunit gamma/tau
MFSKKYRPAKFNDLIGQESNVVILKEILRRGAILPLIFTGPFGSGKTSASRVFAKAVLCKQRTAEQEPCCVCGSCVDFEKDQNINYQEIDAASNGDVDSIRELRDQVSYQAVGSRFKVTNIDEAHNITKQGYNALLKILEEGISHHIFIFCTNEPEKMLETVRSRCWRIHSSPVTASELKQHLNKIAESEKVDAEDAALDLISKVTVPHIRDALNVMEFLSFGKKVTRRDVESYFHLSENKDIVSLIEALENPAECLSILDRLISRMDASTIFDKVLATLLDLEAIRVNAKEPSAFIFSEDMARVAGLGYDFLAISQLLIKIERPLDAIYLRHLILESSRLVKGIPIISERPVFQTLESPLHLGLQSQVSSSIETDALFDPVEIPSIESFVLESSGQSAKKESNKERSGFQYDASQEIQVKHESNIDLRNQDNYKLLRKRKDMGAAVTKNKKQKPADPMSEPISYETVERYLKDKNR